MTEQEWLVNNDYPRLIHFVRSRATIRQARLCMVAWCRLKTAEFFDSRILLILEATERCADDPDAEVPLKEYQSQWLFSREPLIPQIGPCQWLWTAIADAQQLLEENMNEETWDAGRARFRNSNATLAHAVYLSLRESPLEVFTGGEGDAVYYCASAMDRAGVLRLREKAGQSLQEIDEAKEHIRATLAQTLRDIFGNPFRPVTFDAAWRTSTATTLAKQMYDSRDFGAMPILADALQDAGCDNDDVLNHCRDAKQPHVRGCWVVDLVLGKT